jgi:sialidase-1
MNNCCFPALILSALCVPAWAGSPLVHVNVFVSGENGYTAYRIPAIEVAPDASLLAFAEGRKNNMNDPGQDSEIDLVCRRSVDNGRTWLPMQIIEHAGKNWSSGNPATVVDRKTGKIWVLYLCFRPNCNDQTVKPGNNDCQVRARTSDDNGKTWSEPIDLTAATRDMKSSNWRTTVVGPGGMIQDSKGRLVAAAWRGSPFNVFAIYSEDHGRTWQHGELVSGKCAPNENQLVELTDGRILMDYRAEADSHRWQAKSRDGGRTWSNPRHGLPVTSVACAIERFTLKSAGDDRDRILWTGPKGPGRNNLVVRISYDEGQTFPKERLIADEPAAYSDLAILKDKSAGVLWERGDYKFITFTKLTRQFLESK